MWYPPSKLYSLAIIYRLISAVQALPFSDQTVSYRKSAPGERTSSRKRPTQRSVGGPGETDVFIVSLADGYSMDAHLMWLSAVLVENGGQPIPGYEQSSEPPAQGPGKAAPGSDVPPGSGGKPGDGPPGSGGDGGAPGDGQVGGPDAGGGNASPGAGTGGGLGGGDGDGAAPGGGGEVDGGAPGSGSGAGGGPGGGTAEVPGVIAPPEEGGPGYGGDDGDPLPLGAGASPGGEGDAGGAPGGAGGETGGVPGGGAGAGDGDGGGAGGGLNEDEDGSESWYDTPASRPDQVLGPTPGGDAPSGGAGGAGDGGGGAGGIAAAADYDPDDPFSPCPQYAGPPGESGPDPVGTGDGAASGVTAVYGDAGIYVATLVGSILSAVSGKMGVDTVSADADFWVAAPSLWRRADAPETATATPFPTPSPSALPRGFNNTKAQVKAPWHLPFISSVNVTKPNASYNYNSTAGRGVDIYIIDTGVQVQHQEFQGRARWGFVAPQYSKADGLGHGTHVAGLASSKTFGVAKAASIVAVKVIGDGGSGLASDIIAGIAWSVKEAQAATKKKKRRAVINLSISGPANPGLDKMVVHALKSGIPVTIAGGNTGDNASAYSPGRVKAALTAGAVDKKYSYWHMSTGGRAIDLIAPGVNVMSTWTTSNAATALLSGTSMASPQIAGLVAYHLSLYPLLSVKRINHRLKRKATKKLIKKSPPGTRDALIFNCWNVVCYPPKDITQNATKVTTTIVATTTVSTTTDTPTQVVTTTEQSPVPSETAEPTPVDQPPPAPADPPAPTPVNSPTA